MADSESSSKPLFFDEEHCPLQKFTPTILTIEYRKSIQKYNCFKIHYCFCQYFTHVFCSGSRNASLQTPSQSPEGSHLPKSTFHLSGRNGRTGCNGDHGAHTAWNAHFCVLNTNTKYLLACVLRKGVWFAF